MNIGEYFRCADSLMPPEPVVAEVGCFTLDCARAVLARWPKARYICVEPFSRNYATLLHALAAAPDISARIEPHRIALAAHDGEIPFYDLGHEQLASAIPRHMTEGLKLHGIEKVNGMTLRSMLDRCEVKTCDLLLLNCEGAELDALMELCRDGELRKRVKQICTSNHCTHVHLYQPAAWYGVVRALREWYDVDAREPVPNIEYVNFARRA